MAAAERSRDSASRRGGRGATAPVAMRRAVEQLEELIGKTPESVSSLQPRDKGWSADVEVVEIDARIVVASVDTYLRFAEACNRLDLESGDKAPSKITDLAGELTESGAHGKSKGALTGAVEAFSDSIQKGRDEESREPEPEERENRRSRPSGARRTTRRKETED